MNSVTPGPLFVATADGYQARQAVCNHSATQNPMT